METKIHKKIFSNNLNYYLKQKGCTQSDLLKVINVSKSTISTWCRGTRLPRMHHIQALADYLNIDKSKLIEEPMLDNNDISFIIEDIKTILKDNKNLILDGKPLDEECANILISHIQEGIELIKVKNTENKV